MSGAALPHSRDESYSRSQRETTLKSLSRISPGLARLSHTLSRLSPGPGLGSLPTSLDVPIPRNTSKFQSLNLRAPYNFREQVGRRDRALQARRERWLREFNHYFSALIIGLLLGVLSVAFHLGYSNLAKLRLETYFNYAERDDVFAAYLANSGMSLAFLFIPCLAVLVYPSVAGSGIPGVLAFLNGINVPTLLSPPVYLLKFVGSIFSVASGLALGPEGPAIHTGAAFGSLFCTFWYKVVMRRSPGSASESHFEWRRQHFTAMGAGAGVAALFRAPLAGTVFVIEEAANHVNIRDVWATFVACVTAFAVVYSIEFQVGYEGTFVFHVALGEHCGDFHSVEYVFFGLLGIACGIAGACFNSLQRRLNTFRAERLNSRPTLRALELVAIALLTSAVAVYLPMVFPCQDNTAQELLAQTTGCLEGPLMASVVKSAAHKYSHGAEHVSYLLEPSFFGIQYSRDCLKAIDYDTCRTSTDIPFQNCTLPRRPFQESACYLPGIESRTHEPLFYCCGFDSLEDFKGWVDSDGMAGAVYGHHKGGRFVVTRPHLPLEVDKASRNGRHFCRSGPGQAPQYNPAALLMTTPLGSDVANALFTQGIPQLFPARVLAIYLVVYFSLAVLTSGAAIPGGLIVPFVVMGGVIGRLAALFFTFLLDSSSIHSSSTPSWLAAAWEPLMSYIQSDFYVSPIEHRGFSVIPTMPDPGAYAIVGAAAFMAATGRLSLFFTVIMLEATGYISFVLPISIGAIVATLTGNFFNEGLYHILMEVAKMPYLPTMASIDQEAMRVKELFAGLKCHIISPVGDIHRWKELLDGVQHNGFPVVDSEGRLKGVILREALAAAIDEQLGRLRSGEVDKHIAWHLVYRRVQREMDAAPVTVRDRDPADQALLMFSRMRLRHMVVLSGERPVFLLTRHDLHPHAVTHSMFLTKSGKGVSNGHGNSINRSDRGAGRGGFPFSGLFPGTVAEGAEESPEKEPDPPSDGANRSEGGAEPRVDLEEAAAATAGGGDVETMQQNGSSGEGRKESRFGVWDILRPLRI